MAIGLKIGFGDIALALKVYPLLARASRAIATQPFTRYSRWLGEIEPASGRAVCQASEAEIKRARAIGKAVDRAARLSFWDSECMPRAMATCQLLREEGIDYVATIGARLTSEDKNPMLAHAWVSVGGVVVSGEANHDQHAPLVHFRPGLDQK